jgi:hypothetical protein
LPRINSASSVINTNAPITPRSVIPLPGITSASSRNTPQVQSNLISSRSIHDFRGSEELIANILDELETQKRLFENLVNSKSGLEELKAEVNEGNASFTKDFEDAMEQNPVDSKKLETLLKSIKIFYDIKIQVSKVKKIYDFFFG